MMLLKLKRMWEKRTYLDAAGLSLKYVNSLCFTASISFIVGFHGAKFAFVGVHSSAEKGTASVEGGHLSGLHAPDAE
jgi:hypothetical protein